MAWERGRRGTEDSMAMMRLVSVQANDIVDLSSPMEVFYRIRAVTERVIDPI